MTHQNTSIKLIKLRRINQIDMLFFHLSTDHILFIIALWLQCINLPFNRSFFLWWFYALFDNISCTEVIDATQFPHSFHNNYISEKCNLRRSMQVIFIFFLTIFFLSFNISMSIFEMVFERRVSSLPLNNDTT